MRECLVRCKCRVQKCNVSSDKERKNGTDVRSVMGAHDLNLLGKNIRKKTTGKFDYAHCKQEKLINKFEET